MNYTADQRRKLWGILVSLALAITVAITLDCLPVATDIPTDVLDSSVPDTSPSTLEPDSEEVTDTTPPDTDTDTQSPENTEEQESTTPETDIPDIPDTSFVLTFLGECAPGSPLGTSSFGSLNAMTNEKGVDYYFSQLYSILSADDLTVAANSCIFTDNNASSDLIECVAPASSANIYKYGSVDFLSVAAPILNEYSDTSLADTKSALDTATIAYADDGQITYFENAGIRIALVSLQLTKNLNTADDTELVRTAKASAEYVIVYFWGGDNNSHAPEEWLTTTLRAFADAGASLIVGCGNGVLRPLEKYYDTTIAYSLGTLIDGSSMYHENATALLQLKITKDEAGSLVENIQLIPCYVYKEVWQPCLVSDPSDEQNIVAFLYGEAELPTEY